MKFYIVDNDKELKQGDGDYTSNPRYARQYTFAEAKGICLRVTNYDDIQDRFRAMLPVPKENEKDSKPEAPKPEQMYYLWCVDRDKYWKPNSDGYTLYRKKAGKYTLNEATRKCLSANIRGLNGMMIPCRDEPEQLYYIICEDEGYWLARGDGYTKDKSEAFKYSKERAERACSNPINTMVPVDD